MSDEPKPIRYSHSKLKNQATCPARNHFAALAYEGKIETDPAYAMAFGIAAHKGIEEKLLHGLDPYKVAQEYIQQELIDKYPGSKLSIPTIDKKWELVQKCLGNFERIYYPKIMSEFQLEEALGGRTLEQSVEVKLEAPFRKGIFSGVVDLILPSGIFADWKTGMRVPSDDGLLRDPQSGIYYYLARENGLQPPRIFEYIYLTGKNVKMKRNEDGKAVTDRANPEYLYSFKVHQDEPKITRLFAEYVNPLAEQYENGVLYKNPSDSNCNGCQYKSACWQTELPSAKEAREALVLDIIGLVTEED